MANGIIRVKSINNNTNSDVRPEITGYSPAGVVKSHGADIDGYVLQEPKTQTINVSSGYETSVLFKYLALGVEPEYPIEPEEPEIPEVIDIPIRYFCDNSVNPSSVNTFFWNWNTLTTGSASNQFGINLTGDFWRDRSSILEIFAVLGDSRTRRSKINETDFHKLLFKAWRDSDSYSINLNGVSWNQFQNWSNTELSCLTILQKASLFYTVKTRIMTLIFQDGIDFTKGKIPDIISKFLAMLPNKVIDWIDYNDIAIDPANGLIGATSSDLVNENVPELFDAFQSYVNIEPSALLFGEEGLIGHNPYDYVNKSNDFWGMKIPRSFVDWSSFTPDGFANADHETKLGTIVAETVLHEYGHSVSYHFLNTHVGQVLHDTTEWKNIGGHNGSHLVKTRRADQTGGMPKTDSGREASPSDYGCSSPAEDFAESFCLYIANRPLLQAKYPQRYAFMEKYVKPIV